MTFAEHAVAQVLREIASEMEGEGLFVSDYFNKSNHAELVMMTKDDFVNSLRKIAQKLSPKPPGEK